MSKLTRRAITLVKGGGASVAYLPTFALAPQVVYSQVKAVEAYTGPAARLVKASDLSTMNLPFTEAGELDPTGVATFTGASTTAADLWCDQLAGAANAERTTAEQRPQFYLANAVRGKFPIMMGTNVSGQIGANGLAIPSSVVNSRTGVTVLAVFAPYSGAASGYNLFSLGTDATATNNLNVLYATPSRLVVQNQVLNAGSAPCNMSAPSTLAIRSGSGTNQMKLRLNGVESTGTSSTAATLTGGVIGNPNGAAGPCGMYFFAVYPGVLTDAEISAWEAWAAARFDVVLAPTVGLTTDGDSITCGRTGFIFGRAMQFYGESALSTRVAITNFGVGGQTAAQVYARRATTFAAGYSASRAKNLLAVLMGTNDITQNSLWTFADAAVATTTATATISTNVLTVADATGIAIGQTVNAVGVPSLTAATYVTGVSGTSITISNNVTAALSDTAVKFGAGTTATSAVTASPTLPVASAAGFAAGHYIRATGVPFGTTVLSIAGNVLTLSGNVTVSNGAVVVAVDPAIANTLADGIYTNSIVPYVAAALAFGYNGVDVGTVIERATNTTNVGYEVARLRLNSNIVAGAAANNYGVIPYATPGNIQMNGDGIHPMGTPSGYGVLGGLLAARVNERLAA